MTFRRSLPLAVALLAAAPQGGAPEDGLRLFREGQYQRSAEAFARAAEAAGAEAPAELLMDHALAALAAGDLPAAEGSAEKAAARDPRFARGRDFLRGNVAFTRCEEAEARADAPADPPAPGAAPAPSPLDAAIAQAETARAAWIAAARGPEDWPAARRNVERAARKLEDLRKKKEEREKQQQQQKQKDPQQQKDPQKGDPNQDGEKKPESRPESQPQDSPSSRPESRPGEPEKPPGAKQQGEPPPPRELSPEQIQRMLDKLDDKEKQRLQLQRARARTVKVPKDW